MSAYTVRAMRWKHGWELRIDGVGVTQSRNLDGPEQMVRAYIETLTDRDTSDDAVDEAAAYQQGRQSPRPNKRSARLPRDLATSPTGLSKKACLAETSRRSFTCLRSEYRDC